MNHYRILFPDYTVVYCQTEKPLDQVTRLLSTAYGLRSPSGGNLNPKQYISIDRRDPSVPVVGGTGYPIRTFEEILVD